MKMIRFKKTEASNYGYLKNCEILHGLIEELLKTEEDIFTEILKIILSCKSEKEYEEYTIRFFTEHKNVKNEAVKCLSYLGNIYNSDYDSGGLRGRFLELLMFYLLKKEYTNVDMRCFLSNGIKTSEKEIDVYGWDDKKIHGEFFECKINYKHIYDEKWGEYLKNLTEVNEIFNSNNKYGFVSLANDKAFFLYMKDRIGNNYGFNKALIIGRKLLYPNNFFKRASCKYV